LDAGNGFRSQCPKKEGSVTTKLYWAYGSNLNKLQMQYRCPAAIPLEALTVENLILRFRGVADVAYRTGAYCEGALWAITPACERELDIYEGVGFGGLGLYRKCYFDYTDPDTGMTHKVLYYKMNRHGIMPPSEGYLDCIVEGYADFGIDITRLKKAVEHSWRRKDLSGFMAYRWHKAGKPKMARPERFAMIYGETDEPDEPVNDTVPSILRSDLAPSKLPPPVKLPIKERPVKDEALPDVCLRTDPDNPNWTRAVTLTDKGEDYFAENIKAQKIASEWQFRFSTHVVAGLLQKKRLTVAIFEKLRKVK
jgi:hypothetical protein